MTKALSLSTVRDALDDVLYRSALKATVQAPADTRQASVAMLLRERDELELLLIERASRPTDPWSGQVAMPGGRRDPEDRDLIATAIRETYEEVGLHVTQNQWLVGLGEMQGHRRVKAMVISAEVFEVDSAAEVGAVQNSEVARTMWVPFSHLFREDNAVHYRFGDLPSPFPGVLLPDGKNVLWGLTHRFIHRFVSGLGYGLASPRAHSAIIASRSGDRGS